MEKLVNMIEKYELGSKTKVFDDYIFEDLKFAKGFMVFLNQKYDKTNDSETCKKLGNYLYTERYYYCEELPEKEGNKRAIFILFNPSKACPDYRDGTIENCYNMIMQPEYDYKYLEVLNVFSSRNPKVDKKFLNNAFNNTKNVDFIKAFFNKRQGCDVVIGWGDGKENDYNSALGEIKSIISKAELQLNQFYIGINLENKEILNYLNNKRQHPGNLAWTSFGGFKNGERAVLKKIK